MNRVVTTQPTCFEAELEDQGDDDPGEAQQNCDCGRHDVDQVVRGRLAIRAVERPFMIPAVGYRWLRWNAVFSFWFAYIVTRPLGASIADGLGKPRNVSGLGLGDGWVALVLAAVIMAMVAYLGITGTDVQSGAAFEGERR